MPYKIIMKINIYDSSLWLFLFKRKSFVMAYMSKGESDFDILKCIFQEGNDYDSGMEDHEVIEISSNTEVKVARLRFWIKLVL